MIGQERWARGRGAQRGQAAGPQSVKPEIRQAFEHLNLFRQTLIMPWFPLRLLAFPG